MGRKRLPSTGSGLAVMLLILILAAGCHLPSFRGPVSASVATSRQFSQQGIAALERNQPREAEELLAKAVAACPTDRDARSYYAETLWLRNAQAEAVEQQQEACKLSPEDPGLRTRLAEMYLTMGRMDQARRTIDEVIEQNPKFPAAWAIHGRVMRAQGDMAQALADFHRTLGYMPDDRRVLADVADLYQQLHQPQRTLEVMQSLADTYPPGEEPQEVLFRLGLAFVAVQRYDDGIQSYNSCLARGIATPEILCHLAEAQWLSGRSNEAATSVQQALALDSRHAASLKLFEQIRTAQTPQIQR